MPIAAGCHFVGRVCLPKPEAGKPYLTNTGTPICRVCTERELCQSCRSSAGCKEGAGLGFREALGTLNPKGGGVSAPQRGPPPPMLRDLSIVLEFVRELAIIPKR